MSYCNISKNNKCWSKNARFGHTLVPIDWTSESAWPMGQKGNSLDAVAYNLAWTQYAYSIWIEKNRRIVRRVSHREEDLVHDIVNTARLKVSSLSRLVFRINRSQVASQLGIFGTKLVFVTL